MAFGSRTCGVQWRLLSRARGQFLGACRETGGDCSAYDRTSPYGHSLVIREISRKAERTRSGARALRSCRASCAGDAIWPRHRVSILAFGRWACGCLATRRPRSRKLTDAQGCARDRPAGTLMYALGTYLLPLLLCGNYATANALLDELSLWRTKKAAVCGRRGECAFQGWLVGTDRQSLRSGPDNHRRDHRMRSTGATLYMPCASHLAKAMRISANSTTLGAASTKR